MQDRRAELTRLIRGYGAAPVPQASQRPGAAGDPAAARAPDLAAALGDLAAVLAWAKGAAARLAELDSDDDRIAGLQQQEAELAARPSGNSAAS